MDFTVQETLQDAIIAHKYLISMYSQYGIECSNTTLRNMFMDLENIARKHNLKIFELMHEKGYYPVTEAPCANVKQTLKMHTQMQSQLEEKLKSK